jgi:hypothetical protein
VTLVLGPDGGSDGDGDDDDDDGSDGDDDDDDGSDGGGADGSLPPPPQAVSTRENALAIAAWRVGFIVAPVLAGQSGSSPSSSS